MLHRSLFTQQLHSQVLR